MKKVFLLIFLLLNSAVQAQGKLNGAMALVEVRQGSAIVQQNLYLSAPDSTKQFTLKMLAFEGNRLGGVSAHAAGQPMALKRVETNGLISISIELPSENTSDKIELAYTVETKTTDRYVPFFFTEWAAANSDDDFFTLKLRSAKDLNYTLLFPNLKTTEKDSAGMRQVDLQIPALTSMLRLKVNDGSKTTIALATWMDGLVAVIFVLMGIVIWRNRKHLAYG